MTRLVTLLLAVFFVTSSVASPLDDSVCIRDCSGHGSCVQFVCHCELGWYGEDCAVSFGSVGDKVYYPLAVGDTISMDQYSTYVSSRDLFVLGLSSASCHKCAVAESHYEKLLAHLTDRSIPFVRMEATAHPDLMKRLQVDKLPAVVVVRSGRPTVYDGVQSSALMARYVDKLAAPPVTVFQDLQALNDHLFDLQSLKRDVVIVVAVLTETADEFEDFLAAATELQHKQDTFFIAVPPTVGKQLPNFATNKWIKRFGQVLLAKVNREFATESSTSKKKKKSRRSTAVTLLDTMSRLTAPCIVSSSACDGGSKDMRFNGQPSAKVEKVQVFLTNLEEDIDVPSGSLADWISLRSIPLVSELTGDNFQLYASLRLPMVMLFAGQENFHKEDDLHTPSDLLVQFRKAATYYHGRLSFVYANSRVHHERMRVLGIYDGLTGNPSVSVNRGDDTDVVLPMNTTITGGEAIPVNRIRKYCDDFLAGKLERSHADLTRIFQERMLAAEEESTKETIETIKGTLEHFANTDNTVAMTAASFDRVVNQVLEDVDLVIVFHKSNHRRSMMFAPFFKRVAKRFLDLKIDTVKFITMNVDVEPIPLGFEVDTLPKMVMLPAFRRESPFMYYSGVAKVLPMMLWIQQHARHEIKLPELPQFDDQDRELYKDQVKEMEWKRKQKTQQHDEL